MPGVPLGRLLIGVTGLEQVAARRLMIRMGIMRAAEAVRAGHTRLTAAIGELPSRDRGPHRTASLGFERPHNHPFVEASTIAALLLRPTGAAVHAAAGLRPSSTSRIPATIRLRSGNT